MEIFYLKGLVCNTTGIPANSMTYQGTSDAALVCGAYLDGKIMGVQQFQKTLSVSPTIAETFSTNTFPTSPPLSFAPLPVTSTVSLITSNTSSTTTPSPPSISTPPTVIAVSQPITASSDVSQNTAISDRPKAKPVSKKEGKNIRKSASGMAVAKMQQQATLMAGLQQQYQQKQRQHTYQVQQVHQLQQLNQQLQLQLDQVQVYIYSLYLLFVYFDT